MLMVPSQIKNVLTFLLFWSLAIAILEAWKTITEKRVTDKTCQSPRFLAKLLPAPSQRKNVLAILVDLKFRDGHIRNKKILQKKMWQTKCSKPIFLPKLLLVPSQMKNVLRFLTVLKSYDGHIRNLKKNYRKKAD